MGSKIFQKSKKNNEKMAFFDCSIFLIYNLLCETKGPIWKPKSIFFYPSNKIKVAPNIFLHQKIYGTAYLFEILKIIF